MLWKEAKHLLFLKGKLLHSILVNFDSNSNSGFGPSIDGLFYQSNLGTPQFLIELFELA